MSILSVINEVTGAFTSPSLADSTPDASEFGLTPEAYARYQVIEDDALAAPGEIAALTAAVEEMRSELVEDNRISTRLTFEYPHDPGPQVAAIKAARPAKEAKLKRTQESLSAGRKRNSSVQKLMTSTTRYARAFGRHLTPAAAVTVAKGATVEGCQEKRKALFARRKEVGNAPIPLEDGLVAVKDMVLGLAAGPQLARMRPGKPHRVAWPLNAYPGIPIGGGTFAVTDAVALACWLAPEKVIDELTDQLRQQYDGKVELTAQQKATQIAAIDAEILQIERVEAEIVWRQRAQGIRTPFRADLDPRALLGVDGPAPGEPEIA